VKTTRLAIPSKGRLKDPSLRLLESNGIKVEREERQYVVKTSMSNLEVVYIRAFDIPIYVEHGAADLGITGYDIVKERESEVYDLADLDFGECELVLAVPQGSGIERPTEIRSGSRIATEYRRLAQEYFNRLGKDVSILTLRGTIELAARLGLADAIVDLSTTGETLRRNRLRKIDVILSSRCRLIANKVYYKSFPREVESLLDRIGVSGAGP